MDTPLQQEIPHSQIDHLTMLPVELLATIFSELSVVDIVQARSLSKQLKAVIDTNELIILRPIINHHKARIRSDHQVLCCPSADLYTAFQGFVNHCATSTSCTICGSIPWKFSQALLRKHYSHLYGYNLVKGRGVLIRTAQYLLSPTISQQIRRWTDLTMFIGPFTHGVGDLRLARDIKRVLKIVPPILGQYKCHPNVEPPYAHSVVSSATSMQLGLPSVPRPVTFTYHMEACMLGQVAQKKEEKRDKLSPFECAALLEKVYLC